MKQIKSLMRETLKNPLVKGCNLIRHGCNLFVYEMIEYLPIEIWIQIFQYLNAKDIKTLRLVCDKFYKVLIMPIFWTGISFDGFQFILDDERFSVLLHSKFKAINPLHNLIYTLDMHQCQLLTDEAMYQLSKHPLPLRMIDLTGCNGISENGILHILKSFNQLHQMTLHTKCSNEFITFISVKFPHTSLRFSLSRL